MLGEAGKFPIVLLLAPHQYDDESEQHGQQHYGSQCQPCGVDAVYIVRVRHFLWDFGTHARNQQAMRIDAIRRAGHEGYAILTFGDA